ncbi:unnamed protein product [Ilex paraguariensis]|uniref:Uncharacterized protein n=1 Tax=Ilex paraguariensis TaxID=185542 RepID=A0ABC8RHW5_9AQUA
MKRKAKRQGVAPLAVGNNKPSVMWQLIMMQLIGGGWWSAAQSAVCIAIAVEESKKLARI